MLFSTLKQLLSQTQHKDLARIKQSHKERLGRAQQRLLSFLGRLASSETVLGIVAHQGGGLRV